MPSRVVAAIAIFFSSNLIRYYINYCKIATVLFSKGNHVVSKILPFITLRYVIFFTIIMSDWIIVALLFEMIP